MKHYRVARFALASLAVAALTAGCSAAENQSANGDGSRVKLYTSLAELASDSQVIAEGSVSQQSVVNDITPNVDFTLSVFHVEKVSKGSAPTDVVVRQFGSESQTGPSPLLKTGKTYVLFLTPSGLDGSLASQYYITGGSAGIYQSTASAATPQKPSTSFLKVGNEGDSLPATVELQQLLGG